MPNSSLCKVSISNIDAIRTPAFYKNMSVSSGVIFEMCGVLSGRSNQIFAQKVDFWGQKVAFYSNLPKVVF